MLSLNIVHLVVNLLLCRFNVTVCSINNYLKGKTSFIDCENEIYSSSVLLGYIFVSIKLRQIIGQPAKNITYPVRDLQ